jgi:hypothetical protein
MALDLSRLQLVRQVPDDVLGKTFSPEHGLRALDQPLSELLIIAEVIAQRLEMFPNGCDVNVGHNEMS